MALSEQGKGRVTRLIAEHLGIDAHHVTPEKNIVADLGADSLDTVELVMTIEDEFGIEIPDERAERVATVEDAYAMVGEFVNDAGA